LNLSLSVSRWKIRNGKFYSLLHDHFSMLHSKASKKELSGNWINIESIVCLPKFEGGGGWGATNLSTHDD